MINLSTTSKLSQEDVIKKALAFFGPGGYGLEVQEQSEGYIAMVGGGGGVEISAKAGDGKTAVEIGSREWDYQAKAFIDELK